MNALAHTAIIRSRDLPRLGVSREYLRQLVAQGLVERAGRGMYRLPVGDVSAQHTLVEVSRRIPNAVICLLSALRFHNITTQAPSEVWLAIDGKAWRPRVNDLPVRIVRASKAALTAGIEKHMIEGVSVRVYGLAKTVADCFKYRNKIGLDVALEALRESVRRRRIHVDDLWHFARICRVANVMRPYLESLE